MLFSCLVRTKKIKLVIENIKIRTVEFWSIKEILFTNIEINIVEIPASARGTRTRGGSPRDRYRSHMLSRTALQRAIVEVCAHSFRHQHSKHIPVQRDVFCINKHLVCKCGSKFQNYTSLGRHLMAIFPKPFTMFLHGLRLHGVYWMLIFHCQVFVEFLDTIGQNINFFELNHGISIVRSLQSPISRWLLRQQQKHEVD